MAPSQTLPDPHGQDSVKFSPHAVSRLDEEDEEWQNTLRPGALEQAAPRSAAHSRESSIEKLQRSELGANPPVTQASASLVRIHTASSRSGINDRAADPKSATYGHHRQTSIVHGIQHSSNADREQTAGFFYEPAKCRDLLLTWFQYSAYTPKSPAWQRAWHQRRAMQQDSLIVHALTWGGWGDQEALARRENAVAVFAGKLKCPRLTIGSSREWVHVDRDLLPKGSEQDEVILMEEWGHWFNQLDCETFNGHVETWLTQIGAMPVVEDA